MGKSKKLVNKLVTRRDFLVAGAVITAAGALTACSPSTGGETTVTNTVTKTNTATVTATTTAAGATGTVTKTVTATAAAAEKTYNVMDPQGILPARDTVPLAPRLDTLVGKKIWVMVREVDPLLMPIIADLLPEYAPGVGEVTAYITNPGVKGALPDGVIVGNGF